MLVTRIINWLNYNKKRVKNLFIYIVYFMLLITLIITIPYQEEVFLFFFLPVFYINMVLGLGYAISLNIIINLAAASYYGLKSDFDALLFIAVHLIYSFIVLFFMHNLKKKNNIKQSELKESLGQLAVSYRNLESTQTKLVALTGITRELLLLENERELFSRLIELLHKYLLYKDLAFFKYEYGNLSLEKSIGFEGLSEEFLNGLARRFSEDNFSSIQIINLDSLILKEVEEKGSRLLLIPVYSGESLKGIILILSNADFVQEEDKDLMAILTDQLGLMIDKINLLEDTHQLAITDSSTGLFNQRFFYKELKKRFLQAVDHGLPISVIILDIDDFKVLNDQYGHLFGDKVLSEIALLLNKNIRDNDILARYGGEEFAFILPATNQKVAYQIADRMRRLIEGHSFINSKQEVVKTTVSGGVASYPDFDVQEPIELVERADRALYRSKNEGKNKVYYAR